MALAFFTTFTTYGTWLAGSSKGKGSVDRQHNKHGTPFIVPDERREQASQDAMSQPAYTLSEAERDIVCQAIVDLCLEKGWDLLAVHVRSNHVHFVVSADRDPGRLMSNLKARASRDLSRAGHGDQDRRRWTRHGSTLHLFHSADVAARVNYTLDQQGIRMARYAKSGYSTPAPAEPPEQPPKRAAHEVSGHPGEEEPRTK